MALFSEKSILEIAGVIKLVIDGGVDINENNKFFDISENQKSLLIAEHLGMSNNNIGFQFKVNNKVDIKLVTDSLELILDKYISFKTNFDIRTTESLLHINENRRSYTLIRDSFSSVPDSSKFINKAWRETFSLHDSPLVRLIISENLYDNTITVAFVIHHIISDGWSLKLIFESWIQLLHHRPIKELNLSDQNKNNFKYTKSDLNYYSSKLKKLLTNTFNEYSIVNDQLGGEDDVHLNTHSFCLKNDQTKRLSEKYEISKFILLLGVYHLVLRYIFQSKNICTVTPFKNRNSKAELNILGYLTNLMYIHSEEENDNLYKYFKNIKKSFVESLKFQNIPYSVVLKELGKELDVSRLNSFYFAYQQSTDNVNFNKLFTTDNELLIELENGVEIYSDRSPLIRGNYNLELEMFEHENEISSHLKFSERHFGKGQIEQIGAGIINILNFIDGNESNVSIKDLEYLSIEEKNDLLSIGKGKVVEYQETHFLHLFEEAVKLFGEQTALSQNGFSISYNQLDSQSSKLASYIIKEQEFSEGQNIIVNGSHCIFDIVAILAVIKAGGVYIPISNTIPKERFNLIVEQSNATIFISSEGTSFENKNINTVFVQDVLNSNFSFNNFENRFHKEAYIIYTSGSTGIPKGVLINQKGLVNLCFSLKDRYNIVQEDKIIQFASLAFDMSVEEIFPYLTLGCEIVVRDSSLIDNYLKIEDLCKENKVTILNLPTSYWEEMVFNKVPFADCIRLISVGGEKMTKKSVDKWFENYGNKIRLINAYGPTEYTVNTTFQEIKEENNSKISIGTPVNNTNVYVVNNKNQILPKNVLGELVISGTGLATGYYKDKKLTKDKFLKSGFSDSKIYLTGDLAYWDDNGQLIVTGRKDDQLKIRGFRVEIGEIEFVIEKVDEVSKSVVLLDDEQLKVFIISKNDEFIEFELRHKIESHLKEFLPHYMIPNKYIFIDKIPTNSRGKVDKINLLNTDERENGTIKVGDFSNDPIQIELRSIWEKVLNIEILNTKSNFFNLGGNSIRLITLSNKIYEKFNLDINLGELFEAPVFDEQVNLIKELKRPLNRIIPVNKKSYPLSSSQLRIWLLSQETHASIAYNLPAIHIIKGKLDESILELAFTKMFTQHDIFRTFFDIDNHAQIQQYIKKTEDFNFKINKINFENKGEIAIQDFIESRINKKFNLLEAPLVRVDLLKISSKEYLLVYVTHHIISDFLSVDIIYKNLFLNYTRLLENDKAIFNRSEIQYKDYSVWEQSQLNSNDIKRSEKYWLSQFEDEIPILNLPTDFYRPKLKKFGGAHVEFSLKDDHYKGVLDLVQAHDCSLFIGIVGLVNLLLHKYTSQEDIVIGYPVANRNHFSLKDQIGVFINTLLLRTKIHSSISFIDLIKNIRKNVTNGIKNQEYPFDQLVEELSMSVDSSRNSLFDVLVNLIHTSSHTIEHNELEVSVFNKYNVKSSQLDLSFDFIEEDNTMRVRIIYNTSLFLESTIHNLIGNFIALLESILNNPNSKILNHSCLTEDEKTILFDDFNEIPKEYNYENIISQFEGQVIKNSNMIAISDGETSLSYKELNEKANQLGSYLSEKFQIKKDQLVGIKLDHSIDLVVSVLGVLKAGGAYVPIDPNFSEKRSSFILNDSNCKVLLNRKEFDIFLESSNLYSKDNLNIPIFPESLVYVIYTSGSTGTPKGVMIEHKNATSFLTNLSAKFFIKDNYNFGFLTNYVFDVSFLEIFGPIVNGGSIKVLSRNSTLNLDGINVLQFTPTRLKQILLDPSFDNNNLNKLDVILVGGEELNTNEYNFLKELKGRVFNVYGPTECTIWSSSCLINDSKLSIGKPLLNEQIFILDKDLNIQPIGIVGEICIGGNGIARGYLNKPELTTNKFITNPFNTDELLYKTGDLGKWLPDGNIEFIGRVDDQVKIRGYRIELGEIETVLQRHKDISTCIVCTKELIEGEKELVSYIVSDEDSWNVAQLREYLSKELPDYMIPGYFVPLQKLPLTSSGKIDKKRLPDPKDLVVRKGTLYVAPRNTVEEKLVNIWSEVLRVKIEHIGVNSNFIELGGHSLKVLKLSGLIYKEFGIKLDVYKLSELLSIEEQSLHIKNAKSEEYIEIPIAKESLDYPLSSSQRRIWISSQFKEANVAYNIPGVYEATGALSIPCLEKAFNDLIVRHESLRTIFKENAEEEVRQFVVKHSQLNISFENIQELSLEEQKVTISKRAYLPFNLEKGPLVRATVYEVSKDKFVLVLVMHHIISDGISTEILFKELLLLYESYIEKKPISFPELTLQYKDYALWQQDRLSENLLLDAKEYWKNKFSKEISILDFPLDKVRSNIKSYKGASVKKVVNISAFRKFRNIVAKEKCSNFVGLLSVLNILLYKYTSSPDFVIGTPMSQRSNIELENQVGCYVNTIPLNFKLDVHKSFESLLKDVNSSILEAKKFQNYPFDKMVEDLKIEKDPSRNPLFDIMINYISYDSIEYKGKKLEIRRYEHFEKKYCLFDLMFNFIEINDTKIELEIEYNCDLFEEATIKRILNNYECLLESIVLDTSIPLRDYFCISEEEKVQLLNGFGFNDLKQLPKETFIDLFEEKVNENKDLIAIDYNGVKLTYNELNQECNKVAHWLTSHYDVRGKLVGVKLNRNEYLIIIIIGILKSGGAYMPIDMGLPEDRIRHMQLDSDCDFTIDDSILQEYNLIKSDFSSDNLNLNIDQNQLSYVIYTSGTQRIPKGVALRHSNLTNFIHWALEEFQDTDFDTVLAVTSISFDLSVFELFYSLVAIKKIRLFESALDILNMKAGDDKILLNTVPSVFVNLITFGFDINKLSALNLAGEVFPEEILKKYDFTKIKTRNLYGPTECTTYSTCELLNSESRVSIGKPILNTCIYLLDEYENIVPQGVMGEICIGGYGVSKGYLNNIELNNQKFISSKYTKSKLYKTGDFGRWLSDGNLEYLGRKDKQVKIRGHRIEIGEIEGAINDFSGIKNCVVVAKKLDNVNDDQLICYLIAEDEIHSGDIRNLLRNKLPNYMIPNYFIKIKNLPTTTNDKIDYKALPLPDNTLIKDRRIVNPSNQVERKLIEIWSIVLNISKSQISIEDNFFDIGGDSFKVLKLAKLFKNNFNILIDVHIIYSNPTIKKQSVIVLKEEEVSGNNSIIEIEF